MTPQFKDLTDEQKASIRQLREEIESLELQQDVEWAKYIKTGDVECYNTVRALESEAEMKGLIAYLPKAGEGKTKRIRDLIGKIKEQDDDVEACEGCDELPSFAERRIKTLESINAWREEYGIPLLDRLPRGSLGNSEECVIANAFNSIHTLTVGDHEWDVYGVSISGNGSYYLTLARMEDGRMVYYGGEEVSNFEIETEGRYVWDSFISKFDDGQYWDLIEDSELIERVSGSIDEGGWPKGGLEEVFRRGMIQDLVSEVENLSFESGKFTRTDYAGDPRHEYVVGTASPMEDAQFVA